MRVSRHERNYNQMVEILSDHNYEVVSYRGKEWNMESAKMKGMQARLRRKERELQELEAEIARQEVIESKFRVDGITPGVILRWSRNFGRPGGIAYTFAAVSVKRYGNIVWYLTGKSQNPLLWEELVENHLAPADEEGYAVMVAHSFNRIN